MKFITDNIRSVSKANFNLRLTIGYGRPFSFEAFIFEVTPNSELTQCFGYGINSKTKDSRHIVRWSPSISLALTKTQIRQTVRNWLDDILFTDLRDWAEYCYGGASFSWHSKILSAACRFFADRVNEMKIASISETSWPEELKTLRWALELWMLDFLMGHQLLTPEDDKAMIEGLLNQRLGDGPVSFRLPNKIFKMQLVPIIKELAHSTVQGLLNILERSEKTSDWSYAFCTMILLLTVAAEIEIALADFLACAPADRDPSRLRHDVEKVTEHLDKDLMEFFIGLFNVKFNPRRDGFNPFRFMRETMLQFICF